MGTVHSHTLSLIRDTLAILSEWQEPIDAGPEEASYFRKKIPRAPRAAVVVTLPTVVVQVAPPPPPAPPPKVVMAPAAAPPPPPPLPPLVLHEEPPPVRAPSQTWKNLMAKIASHVLLLDEPPSDALAKKINTRWKTKNQVAPITVLTGQEPPEQKAFLAEIAKALEVHFGAAALVETGPVEKEGQWGAFLETQGLIWVICCDYTLWQLPKLLPLFREVPTQQTKQLGDKSLFLLPDLSLYLKDPLLKRSLWKALCTHLSPSSSIKG